jgi:GntR family transcriptional regulator, rspAB operon transcriptional repressor
MKETMVIEKHEHLTVAEALRPIDRASKAAPQIHGAIRAAIIRLWLAPNQAISENEVADALGVSRTPVREAFVRLADEGLLVAFPQLGTFVAPISRSALEQSQFLREAVECSAAKRAAERCSASDAVVLRHLLERHRVAKVQGDFDLFHELDESTHQEIVRISGNPNIWKVVVEARSHLDRARRLDLANPLPAAEVLEHHAEFIDAIAAHDPDRAEKVMRNHVRHILARLDVLEAEHPDFFELNVGGSSARARKKQRG